MSTTSRRRHYIPMDAHIRVGCRYIYTPIKSLQYGCADWLEPGDEVRCIDRLDDDFDMAMYCIVETLDGEQAGKIHILALRLAGDLSRK